MFFKNFTLSFFLRSVSVMSQRDFSAVAPSWRFKRCTLSRTITWCWFSLWRILNVPRPAQLLHSCKAASGPGCRLWWACRGPRTLCLSSGQQRLHFIISAVYDFRLRGTKQSNKRFFLFWEKVKRTFSPWGFSTNRDKDGLFMSNYTIRSGNIWE